MCDMISLFASGNFRVSLLGVLEQRADEPQVSLLEVFVLNSGWILSTHMAKFMLFNSGLFPYVISLIILTPLFCVLSVHSFQKFRQSDMRPHSQILKFLRYFLSIFIFLFYFLRYFFNCTFQFLNCIYYLFHCFEFREFFLISSLNLKSNSFLFLFHGCNEFSSLFEY